VDGGKTFSGFGGTGVHDQPRFRFFAPFSAAVARRPFVSEDAIGLLLNVHPSMADRAPLSVSATLDGEQVLAATPVGIGMSANVSFPAAKLPRRVDGNLQVTLRGGGGVGAGNIVTESVLLVRAAPPENEPYTPTVAIDYTTRGLRVEGMPFLGMGYFTASYDVTVHSSVSEAIAELEQTAAEGFTMVQIYRLGSGPVSQILAVLDAAAAVGIYMHLDVCELVSTIVGHNPGKPAANSTAVWNQLKGTVEAIKGHRALLAWYISDDTVNWYHDPLRDVYRAIKRWDPHHPVSAAMAWAGNAFNYRDCYDINMFENYPFRQG
jgi:hypothetical protein